jgi:hypothetical protein
MQAITKVLLVIIGLAGAMNLHAEQASTAHSSSSSEQIAWVQSLDIDQLDPTEQGNYEKIKLMLRSEDIPKARRLNYAQRYLRGDYRYALPPSAKRDESIYLGISRAALTVIGKHNSTESISLIEEKLKQWEAEREKPLEERAIISFDDVMARAVLARLKAVRDIPEVKDANDLVRRLERMLHYIGFEGSPEAFMRALEQEVKSKEGIVHGNWPGLYEEVLMQYGQMLMESGWKGIDVAAASKFIRLDFGERPARPVKEVFEVYIQLARVPRDQIAQWIVDDAIQWKRIGFREECYMQVLADQGISAMPLIRSKLEWAARHRDQIQNPAMGLVALLRVLATTGREQAMPAVELFVNDEDKWVRHYACQVKEYIQQGKVFDFGGGISF